MPKKRTSTMQRLVRDWMRTEVRIRGLDVDEVNMTQLAEDAAHAFDHDEWLDDSDHWVWTAAMEALERVD